uniref:Uncharacterized protein n=1 Tax=Gallus gallus TaxID=9031 RepID=A0A8V0X2C1_CHICK
MRKCRAVARRLPPWRRRRRRWGGGGGGDPGAATKASRRLKFGALGVLVLQNASLVLSIRYVRTLPGERFLPSTAVVLAEAMKGCACVLLLLVQHRGSVRQTAVTLHGAVVAMGQCYVSLWVPMGPYGSLWVLWVPMGRYGSQCVPMGLCVAGSVRQTAVTLHGAVVAMGQCYVSLWVPMGPYGSLWVLWVPMGRYGSQCVPMGLCVAGSVRQTAVTLHGAVVAMGQCYVSLCVPMGPYGSLWVLWVPMGRYGSLWVSMSPYVSLCVSMGRRQCVADGGDAARHGGGSRMGQHYGSLWVAMGPHGCYGSAWGALGRYGVLWVAMRCRQRAADGGDAARRGGFAAGRCAAPGSAVPHLHPAEQPAVRGHLQPARRHLPGDVPAEDPDPPLIPHTDPISPPYR